MVGVLKEEKEAGFGGGMGDSVGNALYITHKAMDELLGEESYYYDVFQVTVYNPNQLDSIIDRIMNDLRRHHRDEAYDATTARDMLSTLMSTLSMIKYALAGIGPFPAVGRNPAKPNVMMLTVKERIGRGGPARLGRR